MIVYDLTCDAEHRFEGWFKSADDYTQQLTDGMLTCPRCGSVKVHKLPSASRINSLSARDLQQAERQLGRLAAKSRELIAELHAYVDQHYDDVGTGFAEEAKRIHYGEAAKHNIRGIATREEVRELHEEGIEALPLPPRPIEKDKLN